MIITNYYKHKIGKIYQVDDKKVCQRIEKEKSWSRTWAEGHKHLGNLLIGTIVFTQIQLLVMIIHDHNNAINTVYRNLSYPIIMIICFDNEIILVRLFSLSKVIYLKIIYYIYFCTICEIKLF